MKWHGDKEINNMTAEKRGRGRPPGRVTDGTKAVSTRLTEGQVARLKIAARMDSRTVSSYLYVLINRHLNELDATG